MIGYFSKNLEINARVGLMALLLAYITSACTTLSRNNNEESHADIVGKDTYGESVVMQSRSKSPVISKLDRDSWIHIRKNTKDDHLRLYAVLGAREFRVAIEESRAYLQKHPRDLVAMEVLSTALAMNGQYSLASYYADLINKYHPNASSEAANLQGLALLHRPNMGHADMLKAKEYFRTAFENSGKGIAPGLNLGHLELKMGDAGEAAKTFSSIKEKCGNCSESLLGYGVSKTLLGDYKEARESFREILSKEPNNALALYRLALLEKNGYNDNEKAKSYLKRILADTSDENRDIKRQATFLLRRLEGNPARVRSDKVISGELESGDQ
ncbi:MAG: tetratricopeptide repeat protein [Oligoflexales bacterium]|nr:tetratricopeptide repeat protein [Oligoflexales bacterium]